MGRYHTLLTALIIAGIVWVLSPAVAHAQNGACPPGGSIEPTPGEYYPADMVICEASGLGSVTQADTYNRYPCDQYLFVFDSFYEYPLVSRSTYIVPPSDYNLSETGRIRFLLWFQNEAQILAPPDVRDKTYKIEYYNSSGQFVNTMSGNVQNETVVVAYFYSFGFNRYYNVYLIDKEIDTPGGTGGYFRFTFTDDEENAYYIGSLQMGAAGDILPPMCDIPNGILPYTPVPTTGPTTPTYTPTNTPVGATSIPQETLQPTPSLTPLAYRTLPPAPTHTPLSIPTIAPLVYPTLNVPTINPVVSTAVFTGTPTITPTATTTPIPTTDLSTIDAAVGSFATQISQPISQSITALTITSTANISSTSESLNTSLQYVGYPIRFIKAIRLYAPNSWEFWFVALSAVFIITFVYVAKFALALISWAIEWIRKIWEAIPLN